MQKLTVSIPIYNKEPFLAESIESVLKQTFSSFELLLIDDCSTDGSLRIAREYATKDCRIKIVENGKNLGNISNGNRCIDLAKTDLVVRLDGDDIMSPGRLEIQYQKMMENPNLILLSCLNRLLGTDQVLFPNKGSEDRLNYLFPFRCPISQGCTIFRKSLMSIYNIRYDEKGPKIGEDWLLFFKASVKGEIGFHNDVINEYRLHEDNISKNRDVQYFKDIIYVMRYIFDFYNLPIINEGSLLYFKKQCKEPISEKSLLDFKLMKQKFIQCYVPQFRNDSHLIDNELEAIQYWLFLKCIYFKKLKEYKKVFGLRVNELPRYFYHQYVKK